MLHKNSLESILFPSFFLYSAIPLALCNIIDDCANNGIELNYINRSIISDNVVQVDSGSTCISESNVTEANTKADNIEKVY